MALGAIRAFEENSIRIPQEISLVGFDDIPEAGFFRPPLSTIKQDFAALGRQSIQCLTAQVDQNRATSSIHTISPFLIERESSSACWYPKKPENRPNASRIASGLISDFFLWAA
jgi:DNA-binding LacI/PurR family transcriptional regulator